MDTSTHWAEWRNAAMTAFERYGYVPDALMIARQRLAAFDTMMASPEQVEDLFRAELTHTDSGDAILAAFRNRGRMLANPNRPHSLAICGKTSNTKVV